MKISKELQERVNLHFKNNEEIRESILIGDVNAIRRIASVLSLDRVKTEDIVTAYESNDSEAIKNLYEKAKRLIELEKLYKDLCLEYYNNLNKSENEER